MSASQTVMASQKSSVPAFMLGSPHPRFGIRLC
uniref:Uncharacterized protein n=1 Tax=Anguilla anguilla TaxID=7936 RepID=A0A0E9VUG4_ANGAN